MDDGRAEPDDSSSSVARGPITSDLGSNGGCGARRPSPTPGGIGLTRVCGPERGLLVVAGSSSGTVEFIYAVVQIQISRWLPSTGLYLPKVTAGHSTCQPYYDLFWVAYSSNFKTLK
jgi:hypothetical protein